MKRLLSLVIVAMLPAVTHAAPHRPAPLATWHLTLETSRGHVVKSEWLPIWRAHHRPFGHWIRRSQTDHGVMIVEYPILRRPALHPVVQPAAPSGGYTVFLWITGYSYQCGDVNGVTASGTVPTVGTVASDNLPFGTRVSIPSLGYSGVVLDRGVTTGGLDLFAPNCAATYAYTGLREVIIS